jgi:hypothetical protein
MILTYMYGGINRSFSGRLQLSMIFYYLANGNRSLARTIDVLLYISIVKPMWCTFYLIYYGLRASTVFKHYLLIFRRQCTNRTWYIACVLRQLAAPGSELNPNPGAANWHNTCAIYQVSLAQCLAMSLDTTCPSTIFYRLLLNSASLRRH